MCLDCGVGMKFPPHNHIEAQIGEVCGSFWSPELLQQSFKHHIRVVVATLSCATSVTACAPPHSSSSSPPREGAALTESEVGERGVVKIIHDGNSPR